MSDVKPKFPIVPLNAEVITKGLVESARLLDPIGTRNMTDNEILGHWELFWARRRIEQGVENAGDREFVQRADPSFEMPPR